MPDRTVIATAQGEMTRLPAFSDCMMLLYGMDGDSEWAGHQTCFVGEIYAGDTLDAGYRVAPKKYEGEGYRILRVDYERSRSDKTVVVSRGNLYRIKIRMSGFDFCVRHEMLNSSNSCCTSFFMIMYTLK